MGHGLVPCSARGRHGPALEIGEGGLVRRHKPCARAAFDGHVADRHPPFHGERADRGAGVLDHVAGAACGADLADDGEDHVLAGDARRQVAGDRDAHVARALLVQRLGREHMLDLAGADAEGEAAEGAVCCGVAVAADERRARQRQALLRPDDVDDALAHIR